MVPAFIHSPDYQADIGPHVFPVRKYEDLRSMLLASGGVPPEAFSVPRRFDRDWIRHVHTLDYLADFFAARYTPPLQSSELPISEEIVHWFETAVYGTMTAVEHALERGACFHIGGGFHHAFADHAEGFCYLNDVAVGAKYAVDHHGVDTVSVVDLDVHQGNGTARIFEGAPEVFTFSMHQENNYPVKQTSDLDVGLPDGIEDEEYLELLADGLRRAVGEENPGLVLYVAGADPYEKDQLGGLRLSQEGLRRRDRAVFQAERVEAPVVVCLAGGYAVDPLETAAIHFHTAQEMLERWPLQETT